MSFIHVVLQTLTLALGDITEGRVFLFGRRSSTRASYVDLRVLLPKDVALISSLLQRKVEVVRETCPTVDLWICGSVDLWFSGSVDLWFSGSLVQWISGSVLLVVVLEAVETSL